MNYFNLPEAAKVQKIVPKNAFDAYTNSKQKQIFSDKITRITWTHKLSRETINLESTEIKEVQIFRIEIKAKDDISQILDIIDKAIPYHIIFFIEYLHEVYLSTSKKHPNPANENISVIDWTFKSDWYPAAASKFKLNLKQSIDAVYKDVCVQLSARSELGNKTFDGIIQSQQQVESLKKEIIKLKSGISRSTQFNRKVELNILLKEKEAELKSVLKNK